MPKSQWLNNKQRIEAEQRKEEASLFARWNDANDDAGVLQDALLDPEAEQEAAQVARMAPAATSAAVRAQRERVEAANLEVAWLAAELAKAALHR